MGTVPGGRDSTPHVRLVSVQRSRQSPDESAVREAGEQAGLSEAKGNRRQGTARVEEHEGKELFAKKSHKDRSQRNGVVKVQRKTE